MIFKSIFCTFLMVIGITCNTFACNKVSVWDYGAVGNGKTDDTIALQNAINSGKTVYFPPGEYLITSTLVIPSSCTLNGDNSEIKTNSPITMMRAEAGKVKIEGLLFNGSGKAVHGLVVTVLCNSLNVNNCSFHGFYGTDNDQANGIYCSSGQRIIKISGCVFYDIDAPQNGKIGDVYGSCQGVLIGMIKRGLIKNCTFQDIKSIEDGDCIQVYGGRNNLGEWNDSPVRIKNCSFLNIWHRAIKIQASKCHVTDCIISADAMRRPSAAIEVFGNHCSVGKTSVTLDYGIHALTVSGNDFRLKNCSFSVDVDRNHSEELTKLKSDVVYCVGERCVFEDNMFEGGYIGFYAPKAKSGLIIRNNSFKASLVRNIRLYDSLSSEVLIENNSFAGNAIPIDLTGGKNVKIVKNQMAIPSSYIQILDNSYTGKVEKNTIKEGGEVLIQLKNEYN